ncbi:MAG: Gfo/Idh/MocA family oxidoreductase, partial [Pseudoxanthomonas sp.]
MSIDPSLKLRVALVGAGYVAGHHLAALKALDFVEVVGICDTNVEAARALAERHGVPLVAATLAELASARPQAVHVLTPPSSHASITLAALEMGCHVLVEKPMADSVADCETMIAKAREKRLL